MALLLAATIPVDAQLLIQTGARRGFANALGGNYDESRRSPNYWDNPARRRVRAVVWHITDGGFTSSIDWLCNPASEASANDIINRDGRVWNLVPGAKTPWTNGPLCRPNQAFAIPSQAEDQGVNPNWWSYTIENVGTTARGKSGSLTNFQIAALVLRTAQACQQYRLTADSQHILRHAYFDSCTRQNCPGFAQYEMVAWIDAVAQVCRLWRGW